MDKTERIKQVELLLELLDNIKAERVSHNIYGTTNEDSYLSGINEGIDRAMDVVQNNIYRLEEHQ